MILTDHTIRESISNGTIVIEPFVESNLGTNSYDVRLGKTLAIYKDEVLDAKKHNEIGYFCQYTFETKFEPFGSKKAAFRVKQCFASAS